MENTADVPCKLSAFYTGLHITIPANSFYVVTGRAFWSKQPPTWVGIASNDTAPNTQLAEGTRTQSTAACTLAGFTENELTLYLWAEYSAESINRVYFDGFYISKLTELS